MSNNINVVDSITQYYRNVLGLKGCELHKISKETFIRLLQEGKFNNIKTMLEYFIVPENKEVNDWVYNYLPKEK